MISMETQAFQASCGILVHNEFLSEGNKIVICLHVSVYLTTEAVHVLYPLTIEINGSFFAQLL